MNKEYCIKKVNEISKLNLGNGHTPTIWMASIYERQDPSLYQWDHPKNHKKIISTKDRITKHLLDNYDLENNAFSIIAFPHVTTFLQRENSFPQSDLSVSVWNTNDMSKVISICADNRYKECPMETRIKLVETELWIPSVNIKDYYSKDRHKPMKKLTDAFGEELRLYPYDKFT